MPAWHFAFGLERSLDTILSCFQEMLSAPSYSFYLFHPAEERYVLKAVRQSVMDAKIAPSYSGLVSYEGQASPPPLWLSAEKLPVTSLVVKEGDLSFIWLPIPEVTGGIKIGPINKVTKKEMKVLDGYCSFIAEPLQKLMNDIEKNGQVQSALVQSNSRKEKFRLAENYALYYGYGNVEQLTRFDVMIVEGTGFNERQFQDLKASKKIVITYISVMEVHPNEAIFHELSEDDFLFVDGEQLRNEAFGTNLVNLQSKKWIDHLLGKAHHLLTELEADGLFLDTIGNIEWPSIPLSIQQKQLNAAINFLHVLKMLYAEHLIIQNNGLEMVSMGTAPYIDGICWENPQFSLPECKDWTDKMVQRLSFLRNEYQLKVFLLLEETPEKKRKAYSSVKEVATNNDFLLYIALRDYVQGVNSNF